jgi:hypothetical protein
MNPDYPVYIVSKGRWKSRLTSKALERMNVPYKMVVEAAEYDMYASVIDRKKLLILPKNYQTQYDTCDNLGLSKSVGAGAARNYVWDHAYDSGAKRHWILDDNFEAFHRLNRNMKPEVTSGTIFKVAEDFVDRYTNVPLAGFNYHNFCKTTDAIPPITLNTRIYSCLLIQNDAPYRWRGRYNEDTDLSLRILKDGYCTIQFNAFLAGKVTTQRMKGGNTDDFYAIEGTLEKSRMLERLHPDVSKVAWRFNRWHHVVNYKPFARNRLIRRDNLKVEDRINNYGMVLV